MAGLRIIPKKTNQPKAVGTRFSKGLPRELTAALEKLRAALLAIWDVEGP